MKQTNKRLIVSHFLIAEDNSLIRSSWALVRFVAQQKAESDSCHHYIGRLRNRNKKTYKSIVLDMTKSSTATL